ncbi:MAG: hypothetical protein AAGI63_16995, partial [Planctomycetota bacterium]
LDHEIVQQGGPRCKRNRHRRRHNKQQRNRLSPERQAGGLPFSVLLVGNAVLPIIALIWAWMEPNWIAVVIAGIAVVVGHLPRAIAAKHYRQPWSGVVFHSVSVLSFVILQWVALLNHLLGRQVAWRGRADS